MQAGIVAGEASGDLLGAALINAVNAQRSGCTFRGVAGPAMMAAGCDVLFDQNRLAVMGIVEVLGRYRELRGCQRQVIRHFLECPPDVFIGIDAPDFNLAIETVLRRARVKTVHFVSPSVWAWRRYRLRKIRHAVDLMLVLFPFESDFYRHYGIPVRFVGHPLADMIALQPDPVAARAELGLPAGRPVVALLPGSRASEIQRIAPVCFDTAQWLRDRDSSLTFVFALAQERDRALLARAVPALGEDAGIQVMTAKTRRVIEAADVVLVASGTATLECLLYKKPMVVTYRQPALTYAIARRMIRVPYCSLPNLLAGEAVVPELFQEAAVGAKIGPALLQWLQDTPAQERLRERFTAIHHQLRHDAAASAARAVLELAGC